ncbi:MAG: WD40 repeat domain-containing protein [Ktedonobacteraceae bacterium]
MPDKPDFFSPEYLDEYLERSLFSRTSEDLPPVDPSTQLVHDLHTFYRTEGAAPRQALQRVWERLEAEHPRLQPGTLHTERAAEAHLYVLQPQPELTPVANRTRYRPKRKSNAVLTALAALLFLTIMVGSLLAIVHFTRAQLATTPVLVKTPTLSQSTPMPIPNYAYPAPGKTASVSQSSLTGFAELTWSQDSKQVAASTQGQVWIWGTLASGQPLIFDPRAGNGAVVLAWSPGAPRLAVGFNQVQVIDPGNDVVISHYPALSSDAEYDGTARVTALAWSPDGTRLAVATHDPTSGNTVRIWGVNTGLLLYTFTGQRSGTAISSVSWSSDGRYIASANGQSVQAWGITNGFVAWEKTISAATNVAWSPGASNPGFLAFADGNRTEVWNIWANTLVSNAPDTAGGVLAWSPDGHDLASASGKTVVIWDVNTGAHLYTYVDHTQPVTTLAWSQDGNYLASGEDVVRVWSA